MYTVTVKYTKPSADVEFYNMGPEAAEFKKYWQETYKDTGLLIFLSQQLEPDGLTQTTIFLWESESAYLQAKADPIVRSQWGAKAQYDKDNGITRTEIVTETL